MKEDLEITEIKPYNVKELCRIYGVGRKTMYKWLESLQPELGPRVGNYFNVSQVALVFQRLGIPRTLKLEKPKGNSG